MSSAIGTLTPVVTSQFSDSPLGQVFGSLKVTVTNAVGDADYATGGTDLPASDLNLNAVLFAIVTVQDGPAATSTTDNTVTCASYVDGKLKCFVTGSEATPPKPGNLAQVASTTNLSGVTFQIIAFGY